MTFRIFGVQFAPHDYTTAFIDGAHWTDREQAQSLCDDMNKHSDLHRHTVVTQQIVDQAYQEAECWFAENDIKSYDGEQFDAKHMEYIECFISLNALESIGKVAHEF